jgi:P27 family predicted phage terminase small subunit
MRKKPIELHVLANTYRKDRHGNVRFPLGMPKCPAGMTPAARKHWRRLAKLLARAGIIGEVDGLSLRLLAESVDLYLTAAGKLETHGLIAKTTNGNVIQSPFLAIRNRAWEQIVKLAGSFGLHPEARNGMHFDFANRGLRAHDPANPKSRFFSDG